MSESPWGTSIEAATVAGRPFRVYADRPRTVGSVLHLSRRWSDRAHIVQAGRVVTFGDLRAAVEAKARDLLGRGVSPGDRVVILGWNSPDWIINFWATVSVGGVAVLGNAWWSGQELNEALGTVQPRLVLVDERLADRIQPAYTVAPWVSEDDTAAAAPTREDSPALNEDDPAVVIFTSGTSGAPKAAVLSHRALLAGLQMLLHITKRLPHQVDEKTGEAALHTGPMFHVGGVQTLLRAAVVGDTLVMPAGRFDPAEALSLIEEWRVSRWSAVPTMLSRVVDHPDAQVRNVSSLRSLTVGGAATHPDLMERIRSGFPGVEPRVATGYGLTENGGQAVAASGNDTISRPGTVGRALPCVELRITESADGAPGEILLRSPTQMTHYLGESESPIDTEGWLHTGDLGEVDSEHYLWITGRSKDLIIRGGENIAPASVERVLLQQPEVQDAVVFGIPDPDLGEEVAAVIVASGPVELPDVARRLRGEIASFAVPRHWLVQSEAFPENHAGKVERGKVVELAREKLVRRTA